MPADAAKTELKAQSGGMFRIFSSKKYGLFFGGQLISFIGTWMQQVALSWFTYSLTGSPFLLAVVGASSQLPSLVIMPFAGVLADRMNRHRMVVLIQVMAMIQAGILAYLTLTHEVQIWQLVVLGIFAGVVNAFDMPTRAAFVYGLVDKPEDLPNAIAMNAALMNFTRLIGPAIGGFLVGTVGPGYCFLLNSLSYIAVITALMFIKGDFEPKARKSTGIIRELKDGVSYAVSTGPVLALLSLVALFGMGGVSCIMLLPVLVKHIGGGANTLGYLMAFSAVGSLGGTLFLASRKSVVGLGKWIVISSFVFAVALAVFSFMNEFIGAATLLAVLGAAMMVQMAAANTIVQTIVDEDKRGRVVSLFTMAFMGAAPIGSLLAGAAVNRIGWPNTVLVCSIYCLVVAFAFLAQMPRLKRETRPIYIRKGLLPPDEDPVPV